MISDPHHLIGKIAFSIVMEDILGDGSETEAILYVSPLDYWEGNQCQADWTPSEVFTAIEELGHPGAELCEAMIELNEPVEIEHITEHLNNHPLFVFNPDFDAFMKRNSNEK